MSDPRLVQDLTSLKKLMRLGVRPKYVVENGDTEAMKGTRAVSILMVTILRD